MNELYRINLRGKEFISSSELLKDYLQNLIKNNLAIIRQNGDIFVDRNPMIFYNVLDYYSGDGFHLPKNICPIQALKEVEFWKIPSKDIPSCCYEVLYNEHEAQYNSIENFDSDLKIQSNQSVSPLLGEKKTKPSLQRFRYRLLEAHIHPFSTWTGRIWIFISALVTVTSVVVYLLNSDEHFRVPRGGLPILPYNLTYEEVIENKKYLVLITTAREPIKSALEQFTNVFLLLELVLKFAITHQKKSFVCSIQNVLELLTGISVFFVVYLDNHGSEFLRESNLDHLLVFIGILQGLRVIRVLRLVESTPGMKVLQLSLKESWKEFALLVMVLTSFSLIFGSTMYWIELDNPDTFPNIFISIWWALITMTTVGYGDFYPKTPGGYCVATLAAVFGLMLLAMPITILASNFNAFYSCYNYRRRHLLSKK